MDPAKRSIIAITTGVILVNLAFGQAFLFTKKEQNIEQFTLPKEAEQPIRNSSILAALISPELKDDNLVIVQENSILSTSAPAAVSGKEITKYEVQLGDSPSTIAAKFGVSADTVLWANGLKNGDFIKPGDQLDILPITGVKHKVQSGDTLSSIAVKYNANLEKIIAFNELISSELEPGQALIIPDGRIKIEIKKSYASQKLPNLSGYFGYPTTGRISQGLHPYNAIDIANTCGTFIYAAAAGEIIIADSDGWNGGAGKYIKIEHPNGTATLYAHLSQISVQVGQKIAKGQKIGLMGYTGNTRPAGPDGCHLHFSVYGAKNPLAK
ncbi:MAG: LysM peptidoglycan-binding domain-containing protein [bacterium]